MPSNFVITLTHLSPTEIYGWHKHSLQRDYILRVKAVILKHTEKEYERSFVFIILHVKLKLANTAKAASLVSVSHNRKCLVNE